MTLSWCDATLFCANSYDMYNSFIFIYHNSHFRADFTNTAYMEPWRLKMGCLSVLHEYILQFVLVSPRLWSPGLSWNDHTSFAYVEVQRVSVMVLTKTWDRHSCPPGLEDFDEDYVQCVFPSKNGTKPKGKPASAQNQYNPQLVPTTVKLRDWFHC